MTERKYILTVQKLNIQLRIYEVRQWFLCCVHCVHWDNRFVIPNNHTTPCAHIDRLGHKDCIEGQIPVEVRR